MPISAELQALQRAIADLRSGVNSLARNQAGGTTSQSGCNGSVGVPYGEINCKAIPEM